MKSERDMKVITAVPNPGTTVAITDIVPPDSVTGPPTEVARRTCNPAPMSVQTWMTRTAKTRDANDLGFRRTVIQPVSQPSAEKAGYGVKL